MPIHVIVEGKNDRSKLKRLVGPEINILCTFGTLNSLKLETLRKKWGMMRFICSWTMTAQVKIRGVLRDAFPDAVQMYTRRGYAGVEGTPDEYIISQLEKAGLEEYIQYPAEPSY